MKKLLNLQIKCSTVRYGLGVTREVGLDLVNLGAKNVCVMTDSNVVSLSPMKAVLDSLTRNGINYKVYDRVHVEPTDTRCSNFLLILQLHRAKKIIHLRINPYIF